MAIFDPSAMDRVVVTRRAPWLRRAILAAGVLAGVVWLTAPWVRRWIQAERAVSSATLRTAVVVCGDLERDVVVEGRVVAASHPTLFSPAAGILSLSARPGMIIKHGQTVAHVT